MRRVFASRQLLPSRRLLGGVALALVVSAGLPSPASAQHQYNSEGWTLLQPATDTRFVFVSTDGHDANTGRSPAKPVRTIAKAKSLVRDGSADWILLKRGDVWQETFGVWDLSGRSAGERIVIASYGESDARPKIICQNESGFRTRYGHNISHVAIVGVHFEAVRTTDQSTAGIAWNCTGRDLLVEDCYVVGFSDNVTIQGQGDEGYRDVKIRRNVLHGSWNVGSHSQGLYVTKVAGLLVEQNIVDRNGWNPDVPGAVPTQFNQNVYIQPSTTQVVFRGNMSTRAAGAGAQLRGGGVCHDNLFWGNPLSLRFGYYSSSNGASGDGSGQLIGNVVLGGPFADSNGATGVGIWIERSQGLLARNNVVAHAPHGGDNVWAFALVGPANDVDFNNNTVYGWNVDGKGAAFRSSATVSNSSVKIRQNHWVPTEEVNLLVDSQNPGVRFEHNKLSNIQASTRVFKADGERMDFNGWLAQPDVTNDQIATIRFVDPERDLAAYARHLGFTDEESFLAAARQLSRRNWRPELTGQAVAEWVRAGFQVE